MSSVLRRQCRHDTGWRVSYGAHPIAVTQFEDRHENQEETGPTGRTHRNGQPPHPFVSGGTRNRPGGGGEGVDDVP